jgi:cyclophilin family peptidyl-prolyl cis-trans isomerase
MFTKALFVLPLAAFALIAAKPAPIVAPPLPSMIVPPEIAANPANRLMLDLSDGGTVVIQLRPDLAPNHVARIQDLVRRGFYNGLTFHRVIPGFMAQGGDPKGTGEGGSELPDLKAEFTNMPFLRGSVAAARAKSNDSANSQFFIMFQPNRSLETNYTVFGRVLSGMDAVDRIAPGEPPAVPTKIIRASLGDMPIAAAPPPAPAATPMETAPAQSSADQAAAQPKGG